MPDSGEHGTSHTHAHAAASTKRLVLALSITVFVLVVEVVGAIISGSLALLADAAHMATDSMGLVIALFASVLMGRPRSDKWTWGFARAEILGAGVQAGLLILLSVVVTWQAILRLFNPETIEPVPMLIVGVLGLTANVAAMALLFGGRQDSLNLRAAFLEVTSDALGSVAVIIAAIVVLATGWLGADAVASLLISVMIGYRAYIILRQSFEILLEKTPSGLDLTEVRDRFMAYPEVVGVHDMHASQIGTGINVFTAHVVVKDACVEGGRTVKLLHDLQEMLKHDFAVSINHATIQIDDETHASHETLHH